MKIKTYGSGTTSDVVIGIDQSYSGFAMTSLDEYGGYVTQVLALPDKDVFRLIAAQRIVNDFVDARTGVLLGIGMEGYAHNAKYGREIAGELGAAVRLGLAANGHTNVVVVPPTVLKRFVTGKGNVAKEQMLLQCYKKWGVEFDDNNACDSYCVARYLLEE